MINSTTGTFAITIKEEGKLNKSIDESFNQNVYEVKHLKPCTEYEHSVTLIDRAGSKTACNSSESKTTTDVMSEYKYFFC